MGENMEIELFNNIEEKYTPDILESISEVQQARSNFQIEKFVVGQHDTKEMQYYQTVIELQNLYYTLKTVALEIKKTEIKIEKLKESGDEIDEIDAQIMELGLEQTRLVGKGTIRELDRLLKIYNSFEHKYSRDEIEQGQIEYWEKRLHRQAMLESISGGSTAQAAHLDSLRQIGAIEFKNDGSVFIPDTLPMNSIESPIKE